MAPLWNKTLFFGRFVSGPYYRYPAKSTSGRLLPPADDRSGSFIANPLSSLDLPYPGPQPGSMMDNQGDAVTGQYVVWQAIEIHGFLCSGENLPGIPGSGMDEPVDGAFLGRISQMVWKFRLEPADQPDRFQVLLDA